MVLPCDPTCYLCYDRKPGPMLEPAFELRGRVERKHPVVVNSVLVELFAFHFGNVDTINEK